MLEAVVEGPVEILMIMSEVVDGRMPKVRKEVAICGSISRAVCVTQIWTMRCDGHARYDVVWNDRKGRSRNSVLVTFEACMTSKHLKTFLITMIIYHNQDIDYSLLSDIDSEKSMARIREYV